MLEAQLSGAATLSVTPGRQGELGHRRAAAVPRVRFGSPGGARGRGTEGAAAQLAARGGPCRAVPGRAHAPLTALGGGGGQRGAAAEPRGSEGAERSALLAPPAPR